PPGFEVRRLPLIGLAGLDLVVGTDGNVECLLRVAIVVADEHAVAAVGVLIPAFVRRRDARAALARGFERERALTALRGSAECDSDGSGDAERSEKNSHVAPISIALASKR